MKLLLSLLCLFALHSVAAPIQITDSHGKLTFKQPPKRIVVINWTLAEQLIELGVVPVGIADIQGYRQQTLKPVIPAQVVDVGLRAAPDLEKIRALKPDVIVVGYAQRPLMRTLSNIATIVYFKNFGRRYNNEEKSRQRFLELARLFDKVAYAEQRLLERDHKIQALAQVLAARFPKALPGVTVALPDNNHAWIFAQNSMPHYALSQLGLTSSVQYAPSKFGVHKVRIKSLPGSTDCLLYFDHASNSQSSVEAGLSELAEKYACIKRLPAVNAYGGAMSVQYLAEAITAALLAE